MLVHNIKPGKHDAEPQNLADLKRQKLAESIEKYANENKNK